MIDGPDVRWAGHSHDEILRMVHSGPGAALTQHMEDRLKRAADSFDAASELVRTAIRDIGEEWRGSAARGAGSAMRVLRDFDDQLQFLSTQCDITVFGQSSGAGFVRTNVPPKVDVGPEPAPVGAPIDILHAAEDYQAGQLAAKEAEARAREVMQEYTTLTIDRVSSMRKLSPAPQVVLDVDAGSSAPPPDGPHPPDGPYPPGGPRPPRRPGPGEPRADTGTESTVDKPAPGPRLPGSTVDDPVQRTSPGAAPDLPISAGPAGVARGAEGTTRTPVGGFVGMPGVVDGERRGAEPGARVGERRGAGPRARVGGSSTRVVAAEVLERSPGRGTAPPGVAPVGGRRADEDDKAHEVRYGLPSSELFEPESHDGVLVDPYRTGGHVPPATIGTEGDE